MSTSGMGDTKEDALPTDSEPAGPETTDVAAEPNQTTRKWPDRHEFARPRERDTATGQVEATSLASASDPRSRRRAERAIRNASLTRSESSLRASADKLLFVIFLVVGFGGIFALKLTSIDPMVVTGIAVAAMLAYGLLAWFTPRVPPRPDRLGDNLYYMGFVFTLASMSAALVDLQGGADVSTLIGSFGIALFSTIAGIAGRVVLQQFRTEVEDIEQIMRHELLDAALQLKGQLNLAVTDLESFRLGVKEKVQIQLQESLEDHGRASKEHLAQLEALISDLLLRLKGAFSSHAEVLQQLNTATGDTVTALQDVMKRFGAINPPGDILERKLDPAFERITRVITAYEAAAQADRQRQDALAESVSELLDRKLDPAFERITQVIAAYEATAMADRQRQDALAESVNEFRDTISNMGRQVTRLKKQSEDIGKVSAASDTLADSLSRLAEQLSGMGRSIAAQREASEEAATLTKHYQRSTAENLEGSRLALTQLQDSIGQTAVAVATTSSSFAEELGAVVRAVTQQREIILASAEDTRKAQRQIADDLEASRTAVVELERSLARTAQGVVSALNASRESQS